MARKKLMVTMLDSTMITDTQDRLSAIQRHLATLMIRCAFFAAIISSASHGGRPRQARGES